MNKKTIIIIVVVAVAVVLAIGLLVPTFAKEPADADVPAADELAGIEEVPAEELTEEDVVEEVLPVEPVEISTPEPVARPNMSEEQVEYKADKVTYTYHDVASDSEKTMEVAATPQSDLQFGLEVGAQQIFDQPLEQSPLNPNFISLDGGDLYIDFTAAIYDAGFGTMGEASMLDSIADAYLGNIAEVQAVYYSVDGGNYVSGHFEVPGGVPYKTR